jgi:hypothetical protein
MADRDALPWQRIISGEMIMACPAADGSASLSRPVRWAAIALLAATLGGCHNPPPPSPEPGTPAANVVVSVQNQNLSDVDVFVHVNGIAQRLGTVTSQAGNSFEVNWDQIGPSGHFAVVVSPIGSGGAYRTGSLAIRPGAQVAVNVAPVLRNSTTQVY